MKILASELQVGDRIIYPDATITVRSARRPKYDKTIVVVEGAIGSWGIPADAEVEVYRETPSLPNFKVTYSVTQFWDATVEAQNAHEAVNEFHRQGFDWFDAEPVDREDDIKVLSVEPLDN